MQGNRGKITIKTKMKSNEPKFSKVFVVEDDIVIQMIVKRSLEDRFEVTAFSNGMDALLFLREGNLPDIIISDLNTPDMNGMELIERAGKRGGQLIVPALAGVLF